MHNLDEHISSGSNTLHFMDRTKCSQITHLCSLAALNHAIWCVAFEIWHMFRVYEILIVPVKLVFLVGGVDNMEGPVGLQIDADALELNDLC